MTTAKLALVGDRSPSVRAHGRIPLLLEALRRREGLVLDPYWIPSGEADDLEGFDGLWVVPGSPYADPEKVLGAIATARRHEIPFLGTCGGFQHALVEVARNLAGLGPVAHAEVEPGAENPLIAPLACSLLGEEADVTVVPGTRAADLLGPGPRTERFFCSFGVVEHHRPALEAAGVVFSATDPDGAIRLFELPDHPFFLCSLFQPELSSDETWVHPLITGFVAAVARSAAGRALAP
jgi:CTP synthase (UTP-ammonia lyase)